MLLRSDILLERYSASAIERSRGDYQEAWKIIEESLELAHHVPAGFTPAFVYVNAASILSSLVDEESVKNDKDFESEIHLVEKAKSFCHHALQHLSYIEDEFDIAREDLRQRINIALASLHLKSPDQDHSSISNLDKEIDTAMTFASESEKSLMNLKGTKRLAHNSCRQLLVKSDICFQKYKLEPTDPRIKHLEESLEHVQIAQKLADDNNFKEINTLCKKRSRKIKGHLEEVKTNKVQVEDTMDEFL